MALPPPSVSEVDSMARTLAILNGETPPPRQIQTPSGPVEDFTLPSIGDSANVDAMKRVLQGFYGMDAPSKTVSTTNVEKKMKRVTQSLVDESRYDSALRSAMVTEEIDDGSKIGEWEIYMKQDGKRKFYDVVNENGMVIATDLTLYEAAFGIARSLADGKPITCRAIRDILAAEGDYSKALADAIHHRHSISKNPPASRRMILEDRYDVAKERAQLARKKIEELVKPPF